MRNIPKCLKIEADPACETPVFLWGNLDYCTQRRRVKSKRNKQPYGWRRELYLPFHFEFVRSYASLIYDIVSMIMI